MRCALPCPDSCLARPSAASMRCDRAFLISRDHWAFTAVEAAFAAIFVYTRGPFATLSLVTALQARSLTAQLPQVGPK